MKVNIKDVYLANIRKYHREFDSGYALFTVFDGMVVPILKGRVKTSDELYKKDALLLKIDDDYVDIDNINSGFDIRLIKNKQKCGKLLLTGRKNHMIDGQLFVDDDSLRQFWENSVERKNVTIKELKKIKTFGTK